MIRHPRVSVVIPTFQSESRIAATLTRLRTQSFTDFEVVVVNDGSTDATSRVVRQTMAEDARIRLVEQDNAGVAAARNRGIEASCGDLVAFLDDDDRWHPRKLELQVARLAATSRAALVSCFSALIDEHGNLLGWRLGGMADGDVYREMLEWDMVSGGSVAMVVRQPLEAAGGFDPALSDRADWDLWIRLARAHPFTCVSRTLVGYTRRAGSASHSYDLMIEHGRLVLDKARAADPSISDADYRAFVARDVFGMACFCLADGAHPAAWRYLSRALREEPGIVLARPRRWGVMTMLALASSLPVPVYRRGVLRTISRAVFHMPAGAQFDALA